MVSPIVSKILKASVIFGSFFMGLPMGIPWYYGNLAPYIISYHIYQVQPGFFDISPEWIVSVFSIMIVVGQLSLDWFISKFGSQRLVILIDTLLFNFTLCFTYFTIQHSMWLTTLTFSVVTGFTAGHIAMTSLSYASKVTPHNVGMSYAFITCGFSLGAIYANFVVTSFINPDNIKPDVKHSNMALFSQTSIIDNVPACFLLLALVGFVLHLLAFCMQQLPLIWLEGDKKPDENYEEIYGAIEEITTKSCAEKSVLNVNVNVSASSTSDSVTHAPVNEGASTSTNISPLDDINTDSDHGDNGLPTINLKPSEILRTSTFYHLWICCAIIFYSNFVTQNFYKLFSQLWIRDDVFLTTVGSISTISMTIYRPALGALFDRKGVKFILILTLTLNVIFVLIWFITPHVDKWLFFIVSQIIFSVHGSIYLIFPVAAVKLFGLKYKASNTGCISTAIVVVSLIAPSLTEAIRKSVGWFWVMALASIASLCELLPLMVWMRNDK